MDKDEQQVEQPECGCDSSSGDVCCSPGSGKANWRTALFVTVVVLAGAVAAHSVLTNGGKTSPCGGAGICAIDQGNGNGGAAKTASCPLSQANGNGDAGSNVAACAIEQGNGNGDGAKTACCPLEQANGNGDSGCPLEKQACPMEAAAGCCPSQAPADPAPQPAPTGCCPGH